LRAATVHSTIHWTFSGQTINTNAPVVRQCKAAFRRAAFAVDRIPGSLGVSAATPLSRFSIPVSRGSAEKRWLNGLYLDQPVDWDDPYRFFGW